MDYFDYNLIRLIYALELFLSDQKQQLEALGFQIEQFRKDYRAAKANNDCRIDYIEHAGNTIKTL